MGETLSNYDKWYIIFELRILAFLKSTNLKIYFQTLTAGFVRVGHICSVILVSHRHKLKLFGFNITELITIYSCYVHPLLEYVDVIWHSVVTVKQSLTIERIQKRACKIILGYNKFISYQQALSTLNLQPLSTRRESHCLIFAGSLSSCSQRTSRLFPPSVFLCKAPQEVGCHAFGLSDFLRLTGHIHCFHLRFVLCILFIYFFLYLCIIYLYLFFYVYLCVTQFSPWLQCNHIQINSK